MSTHDIYQYAPSLKKIKDKDIAIEVKNLTKDYGKGRGVFDISFKVPRGCTFGYCGTNGAGKTTTLRHIMGFLKPKSGSVMVKGLNAWENAEKIKSFVGYLPGEIAFPSVKNGSEFLKIQAEMVGLKDMSKAEKIINALQLDPTANLRRMSKGMKQKTALVAAFMHSPEIILLDEPTTGLDPLMRDTFIRLIKEEKKRGATIVMSNHMFDELEETCDYVAFIKDGHLIDVIEIGLIHKRPVKEYELVLKDLKSFNRIKSLPFVNVLKEDHQSYSLLVSINKKETKTFLDALSGVNVKLLNEVLYNLEKFFMDKIIGGISNE